MKNKIFIPLLALVLGFVSPCRKAQGAEPDPDVVFIVGDSEANISAVMWTAGITLHQALATGQTVGYGYDGTVLLKTGKKSFSLKQIRDSGGIGSLVLSPGDIIVFGPLDASREAELRSSLSP